MLLNNSGLASEEVRRENLKAIRKRNEWRERYAHLSTLIAVAKRIPFTARNRNTDLILRSLQDRANDMMQEREAIGIRLKFTAYKWV
jgi:hypothetical protein